MEKYLSKEQMIQFKEKLLEEEKSKTTIQKYVRDVGRFFQFAKGEAVTKDVVIRYKQFLMESYKPVSVNSMLAALNCFFKEIGWFDCVVKAIRIQRQTFRSSERELTREEYYRLLKAAKSSRDIRLYLLMETICATGIRVSELPFITLRAVREGQAVVSLKGKTRTVLLPRELCRKLKSYAGENGIKSGSVFITRGGRPVDRSNILHSMKKLCQTAEVDSRKVFPHNLRHLFACLFYKEEKDLSRLADILGHSNVNTTRIYTCISGKEQIRQIERLGLVICDNKTT